MARKQRDRELMQRELDSLRGVKTVDKKEPTVQSEAPRRRQPSPPGARGGIRHRTIILVMVMVFALCIVIFFMGIQVNDLSEQNDAMQSQLDDYQQRLFLDYTYLDAIEAAIADPWVSQQLEPIEIESNNYGYALRSNAVLTTRVDGLFWNVFIVGLDCDCDPPIFNTILAMVNAQSGEVVQAYKGAHMSETEIKNSILSNFSINFWP